MKLTEKMLATTHERSARSEVNQSNGQGTSVKSDNSVDMILEFVDMRCCCSTSPNMNQNRARRSNLRITSQFMVTG